jgi:enediyne biosynthesis protein E4
LFAVVFFALALSLFNACKQEPTLFATRNASDCGIDFQNTIQENDKYNMIDYSYVYNGGGVGIADLDNDGLPEVVFTGNQQPTRLYQNLGNWQFKDITQEAGLQIKGWCTGVTFADINADGLLDIYICRSGNAPPTQRRNLCFLNLGGLRFREAAAELGIADEGWSTQAAFFDYDRDGDLDLYVLNHTNEDRYPNRIKADRSEESSAADHLFRNDNGSFKNISAESGIADDGWGLGLGLGDFNQDGWTDLYISNDFLANDILYLNQQNGKFLNDTNAALGHTSHFSMGTDVADFDNDDLSDIFVADMMPSSNLQRKKMAGVLSPQAFSMTLANGYAPQYMRNTLQKNEGVHPDSSAWGIPKFSEIGQMAGVNATDWSWSPLFLDLDGDGWKDLFISNGYRHDIIDMDFILQNNELGKRLPLKTADQQIKEKARLQPGYPAVNQFFKNQGDLAFSNETQNWIAEKPDFPMAQLTVTWTVMATWTYSSISWTLHQACMKISPKTETG